MKTIIAGFYFEAMSPDKRSLEAAMDTVANATLEAIGGAPWVCVQDDVTKVRSPNIVRDDQGFQYQGSRKYIFQGPCAESPFEHYHDGNKAQTMMEE